MAHGYRSYEDGLCEEADYGRKCRFISQFLSILFGPNAIQVEITVRS